MNRRRWADDRSRYERPLGADEAGAGKNGYRLDAARPSQSLYTTSITQAEILHGLMLLPPGRRRKALEAAVERCSGRSSLAACSFFGSDAALPYALIAVDRRREERPISHFDAQLAAIARSTGAVVATRNVADFADCGIDIVNPWDFE